MRIQLSNRNTTVHMGFIVFVFMMLFLGLVVFPNGPFPQTGNSRGEVAALLGILFLLFAYVFIGRFYKVEMDAVYLYFSRFNSKGKIPLDRLVSVKDELPLTFFFKTAHGINLSYLSESGKLKKIKFLSPETGWGADPYKIPEIKELKRIIANNMHKHAGSLK